VSLPIFPGGITVMGLLAINLLVGGILRLRMGWRVAGVLITHLAVVFMLVAGLVTQVFAVEGQIALYEGEQADYFEDGEHWEVANGEVGGGTERVVEQKLFQDLEGSAERVFTAPSLPFDLVLSGYVPNARALPKGPNWEAAGPVVDGYGLLAVDPDTEPRRNLAGLHVRVASAGEPERQGLLWGGARLPWTFRADGRSWAVKLRHARYPMPFAIRLDDFRMEEHPGTSMAKAYESHVTKLEGGVSEKVLIEMNEPLRAEGLALFQSQWGQDRESGELYSVLSVWRNPSDKWPEAAMWVMLVGMLVALGQRLARFMKWSALVKPAGQDRGGEA